MELAPGYKLTDVGVIPDDWEVVSLRERATFRTGPFGSALHKSDYATDGVPIVNPMHLIDGAIQPSREMTVTTRAANALSEFRMKPGDIVIGRRGEMGRCAVVRESERGWLCGTGSMIIRPVESDPAFLQRVLSSPRAIADIENSSVGSTMINLNQGTLAKLNIQLPSLAEQRAIAAALSDVDALLSSLDRLLVKKRDLKQAAMQQLLTGQMRLPGFQAAWEARQLSCDVTLVSGHHILAGHCNTSGDGFPYLTGPADFPDGQIRHTKYTTRPSTICAPFDILVTVKGSGSGTFVIADAAYCISRQLMALRVREWDFWFLYYSLLQNADSFKAAATGLIPGLSRSDILDQRLPFPPTVTEQLAIATVLSDMDAELSGLEARLDKTRALKQAMMQELLTGRTRLV